MTPTVSGTKCSREEGIGVGWGLVCLGAVCFFFITMDKAFSPDWRIYMRTSSGFFSLLPLSSATAPPPVACRLSEKACSYTGPGWRAWPPQPCSFKGQGVERRGELWEGQGCWGETSIQHSSVASDLRTCFLSPSSLLEGWGGNQHFKGETSWKDLLASSALPISVISTQGCY